METATMTFQEAKQCILGAARAKDACSGEYGRAYKSENEVELLTVIKDNIHWLIKNEVLNADKLELWFTESVLSENNIFIRSHHEVKNCAAVALGNCTVKALGNCTVKALGNSTVKAWDNSTVEAWDNSTVEAWDNSTVKAWGNSTVEALGNCTVRAWGNSTVHDYGSHVKELGGRAIRRDYVNKRIEIKKSDFEVVVIE